MAHTEKAVEALERALSRKVWREDGWEVPAIDVQDALDALKATEEAESTTALDNVRYQHNSNVARSAGYRPPGF